VTRAEKYFRVVLYEFEINHNITCREKRKGKERMGRVTRRNICSRRKVKQAIKIKKGCDIVTGESDMKFIKKTVK
jgi:hypothetical protein